ncbi:MAG: glycoside hydrolase family 2 TIM barrel-domain containing protein [bacterium]|nr:glycoside hydrolase family 2 TIM barrel-domain containing protein [bacterium]
MKKALFSFLFVFAGVFVFLFVGFPGPREDVEWGVNFSEKHAQAFGLNWSQAYLALLDDLEVKLVKTAFHWDIVEPEPGLFRFDDFDFQVREAEARGVSIVPVIGQKTSRWPECHTPEWAKQLSKEDQQAAILTMLRVVVGRYKDSPSVLFWQVENEPFFPFGECPWADEKFLAEEVKLVKSLDQNHSVMITDSGEGSLWVAAARYGDIVGATMYRKVWFRQLNRYLTYPFSPTFYQRKAWLINLFFHKPVIGAELQAEPWGPKLLYDISLDEMKKTMTPEQFEANIDFAAKSGFSTHYLWGAEWWYWMKEKQGDDSYWELARSLFGSGD